MRGPQRGQLVADRYRLREPIGAGATGEVWEAEQLGLDRTVALKLLRPALVADPRARARFEREARVASAMEHPGVVRVFDFGDDGERAFIAMELLRGQPLRQALTAGALPLLRTLAIAGDVADVLVAAHRTPIVHRDLKPENVFLQREGEAERVRVLDFGLAFIAGDPRADRMTRRGVVAGTPHYLSPEQARATEVGPPTDIYALGCMLFEMLTGQVPFHGTDMDVLTRQMFAPPPPLRPSTPALVFPVELGELVHAMLDKQPERRPSGASVQAALRSLASHDGRGRARDKRYLSGRHARVLPSPPGRAVPDAGSEEIEVAIVGQVSAELLLAMAANGLRAYVATEEQPITGADVVFAPGATPSRVGELTSAHRVVVSDVDRRAPERLAALLQRGVADVVERPLRAEELARKIHRAHEKAKRRESGG